MILASASLGRAQEPSSSLQLSAFGTLGVATTSTNQVGFRRDATQFDGAINHPDWALDTRLGVQLSAELDPSLLATVQVVSKYRYDGTYKPTVTLACLDWNPTPRFKVRAGILPFETLPTWTYNDVGYTYPWVRPPVEAFGGSPLTRLKGGELVFQTQLSGAALEAKAFLGSSMDVSPLDHIGHWDLSGGRIFGGWLKLAKGNWRARVGGNHVTTPVNLPQPLPELQTGLRGFAVIVGDPALARTADELDTKGTASWNLETDLVWEREAHQFQFLLSRARTNAYLLPASWYGYVSYGYRIGSVTPYAVFARAISGHPVLPDLTALAALQGRAAPMAQAAAAALRQLSYSVGTDQRTFSAGLRWDFAPGFDLKVQADRVLAHNATGLEYNPFPGPSSVWNGRLTVVAVTLDFILGGVR